MIQNDNRNYKYDNSYTENRPEYGIVVSLIPEGSTVLDLACGEGSLMQLLQTQKKCSCVGIELSQSGVDVCIQKGLNVKQGMVDVGLEFGDGVFDYVICNVTIQMLMYPEKTLAEMNRIANKGVVLSFPNFAYFFNRLELLIKGRMPKKLLFGYHWYNTGHIHQLSYTDMKELLLKFKQLKITQQTLLPTNHLLIDIPAKIWPNLFAKMIILKCEKNSN